MSDTANLHLVIETPTITTNNNNINNNNNNTIPPIKKTRKRTKKISEDPELEPPTSLAGIITDIASGIAADTTPPSLHEHAAADETEPEAAAAATSEPKIPKKRGRKPKGGKIIPNIFLMEPAKIPEPNIIMHLKCGEADLNQNTFNSAKSYEKNTPLVETFQFENTKSSDLGYCVLNEEPTNHSYNAEVNSILLGNDTDKNKNTLPSMPNANIGANVGAGAYASTGASAVNDTDEYRQIWHKLKELSNNLHTNNISDKKSACFWCTCDFDNQPILIPKFELNNIYHSYGCFCSPECATAYLFEEPIDTTTRFERYHLLNHIYCKIYNYTKNIKPAPNPYYTLNKYYGNLSIQEYRKLLKNERLLLVVDKPLSRILPELHEDNDDYMFSGSTISTSNKFKIRRKTKQTKTDILSDTFNLKQ
jgi:hypothetical protein